MKSRKIEKGACFSWAMRQVMALLLAASLATAPASGQQQTQPSAQQQSQQGKAQRFGPDTLPGAPVRPHDIISDNLDRVAASADQILEVLNKEAGLMVEFKRLLVQDCELPAFAPEDLDNLPIGPNIPARAPRSSAPIQRADETSPNQITRPDGLSPSLEQRSGYPASLGSQETLLTALREGGNTQFSGVPRTPGNLTADGLSPLFLAQPELQTLSTPQLVQASIESSVPRTTGSIERFPSGRNANAARYGSYSG